MLLEVGLLMKMILDKALNEDLIFGAGLMCLKLEPPDQTILY